MSLSDVFDDTVKDRVRKLLYKYPKVRGDYKLLDLAVWYQDLIERGFSESVAKALIRALKQQPLTKSETIHRVCRELKAEHPELKVDEQYREEKQQATRIQAVKRKVDFPSI